MKLTERQAAVMRLFISEGECNEGMLANLWPLIRRPRSVTNGLLDRGLVYLGPYWGEEAGYELLLTPAGRELLDDLIAIDLGSDSDPLQGKPINRRDGLMAKNVVTEVSVEEIIEDNLGSEEWFAGLVVDAKATCDNAATALDGDPRVSEEFISLLWQVANYEVLVPVKS